MLRTRCVVCGEIIDSKKAIYCSNRCKKKYYREKKKTNIVEDVNLCIYNDGVTCSCEDVRFCNTCGWNPEVARERLEVYLNGK